MAKVKEVSSYSGSAWGAAVPIGANATNVDMASNPADYDSSSTETSTTLIGTNDVKIISSDTDLTAWGKFNRFRKRVANAIADLSLIAIQSTTPTKGEKLWLDTSGSGLMIPQVNDSIASATDTWSSNKIGNQINAIENGLAIIVEGDICTTAVPAGGYAYIKNNTHGLAEGLYRNKTTSAFPTTGGTANSTVFEYVGAGGLNALNDKLKYETITCGNATLEKSGHICILQMNNVSMPGDSGIDFIPFGYRPNIQIWASVSVTTTKPDGDSYDARVTIFPNGTFNLQLDGTSTTATVRGQISWII